MHIYTCTDVHGQTQYIEGRPPTIVTTRGAMKPSDIKFFNKNKVHKRTVAKLECRKDSYSLYCPNIYMYTLSVCAMPNLLVFIEGIIVTFFS